MLNLTVVPIIAMDLASLRALAYAASLGQPVLALHISADEEEAKRFRSYWQEWGDHVPLEIVLSPYRALVAPLGRYLRLLHDQAPHFTITVVLPELVPPPLLAPRPAQRRRPPPAPRAAPAAGDRDHHGAVSPAELTPTSVESRESVRSVL